MSKLGAQRKRYIKHVFPCTGIGGVPCVGVMRSTCHEINSHRINLPWDQLSFLYVENKSMNTCTQPKVQLDILWHLENYYGCTVLSSWKLTCIWVTTVRLTVTLQVCGSLTVTLWVWDSLQSTSGELLHKLIPSTQLVYPHMASITRNGHVVVHYADRSGCLAMFTCNGK